jgi:hypothetical protein
MQESGEGTLGVKQPGNPGAASRAGQSGEGARSALEYLIQQQRKRDAQLPSDGKDPGSTGRS